MEGTTNVQHINRMQMAEFLENHTFEEYLQTPRSVVRLNFVYSRSKEQRLARLIAYEVSQIFGGGEENG